MTPPEAEDVLRFWFTELVPAQWWRVDPALDETIRARYGAVHARAPGRESTPEEIDFLQQPGSSF